MRDPIRVYIYKTCHNGYRGRVCRSGEDDLVDLIALSFICKYKIPLTHHRSSKYDVDQEIQIGPPESSDVCK